MREIRRRACRRCSRCTGCWLQLPDSALVAAKARQLDRILQACLGLFVETTMPQAEVVAGEELRLRHTAIVRAPVALRWKAVRYPAQRD